MTNLAIKGHKSRGKEVIEILEMLGGENKEGYCGNNPNVTYYICGDSTIQYGRIDFLRKLEYKICTLEEFLEKYPYKVGDKVNYVKYNDEYPSVYTIQKMRWTGATIEYLLDSSGFSALTKDLQPYKEETMEEIKIEIPAGYEFAGVDDNAQQVVLRKIQPQYPKNYEECARLLNTYCTMPSRPGYKEALIAKFQELLICRDAYWKIAGEQLGLSEPWKPDWTNHEFKYCIKVLGNTLECVSEMNIQCTLSFPTAEMRDAFKENFDDDIDFCKEFL